MAKLQSDEGLEEILDFLKERPAGATMSQILSELTSPTSRRTLLRRLTVLKEAGKLVVKGRGKGTHYLIRQVEDLLDLSPEGRLLKEQVQRSLQQRRPVSYNPEFLYSYQPNKSFYLPISVREHLRKIGQQFDHAFEPGTYIKRVLHRFLIDFSWNSSRLEGNTYSLLETEHLIEFGAEAEGKSSFEVQMIMNHKDALEFLVEHLDCSKITVLSIHALLSNNLLSNPRARGQLRQIPVGIGRTVYHPPEIPQLIFECFQHILNVVNQIEDPFEQAFFLMVQLPYLQPFEDVNKRVSRLASNIPLIKNNLSPLSFVDVPKEDYVSGLLGVYELNKVELMRDVFVWAYERSAQKYQLVQNTLREPNIAHMRFKETLSKLINKIVSENIRNADIIKAIRVWANEHIALEDRSQFIRLAERELASLHEGNIAVYRIAPEKFLTWKRKSD